MNNTSTSLPFVILLKMAQVNIIVIFVKKNKMQRISSTIVQIAIILLIPIVFLDMPKMMKKTFKISSLGSLAHIPSISIPSLLFVILRTNFYVMNVVNLVMHWLMNAPHVTSIFTKIVLQGGRMI